MKICTYERQTKLGKIKRLGILKDGTAILDVNLIWKAYFERKGFFNAADRADHLAPSSLHEFLTKVDKPIEKLNETQIIYNDLLEKGIIHTKDGGLLSFHLEEDEAVKLACPMDKITSYRDFYIHEKHVKKGFEKRKEPVPEAWYEIPAYYKGSTAGFIGPEDEVLWPQYSDKLDYELELGMVVAKDGYNIKADKAHNYIFGYTVFNDISARDIQKKEMSVRLGPAKGKDFCSVMGPVIVTADEFDFKEPNLKMIARINGEKWSEGMSGEGNYTWAQMIEHVSKDEWLRAGDFFGSGTVGTGCGLEIDKWIQPGDEIELEVEKIGILKNKIGHKRKD